MNPLSRESARRRWGLRTAACETAVLLYDGRGAIWLSEIERVRRFAGVGVKA